MAKLTVEDLKDLEGKKVLIRVDFNVPIKDGVIGDDNRMVAALPTIKYITEKGGKAVLFSHLGRVKTEEDKANLSLKPVAEHLADLLNKPVTFVPVTRGAQLEDAIANMNNGDVILVENTRFEDLDGKKESGNDPELGQYWAFLGDVFVNDAFGTAHRSHASNVGISEAMKANGKDAVAGYLLEKEIKFLGDAVDNPVRPFVAILGGSKVEDDKVELAKELIEKAGDKLVLPVDNVVADKFANDAEYKTVEGDIPDGYMALDVGEKSVELFKETLKDAKTVVWNGPMGVFEMPNFAKGTLALGEFLATLSDATTIVGGGDSVAAAKQLGIADKLSHVSTGGGSSLEYLEGKTLPAIAVLSEK